MPTVYVPDISVTLVAHTCGRCGVVFGMSDTYIAERRKDHETWYCPNGHPRVFTDKSEAEKLREQLAAKDREIAAAKSRAEAERNRRIDAQSETRAVERRLSATKAVVTRTKKKIVAGRCPCCSHKFKDLAVHMTTRHPDYDPDKAIAAIEAKA